MLWILVGKLKNVQMHHAFFCMLCLFWSKFHKFETEGNSREGGHLPSFTSQYFIL